MIMEKKVKENPKTIAKTISIRTSREPEDNAQNSQSERRKSDFHRELQRNSGKDLTRTQTEFRSK